MNDGYSDDSLLEAVIEKGELVYSVFWDSGSPGAGADSECIFLYEGKYYPVFSFDDRTVAYNLLEDALKASELYWLNECHREIMSKEIPVDRLIQLLEYVGEHDSAIMINGERWLATKDGDFKRM